ncbi:hypothetical protein HanIR_Chr05g0254971 [Helianthus annuus]|nr:hypothetical protein HanIR_Chr05g0254971 [Helianthus annuus]
MNQPDCLSLWVPIQEKKMQEYSWICLTRTLHCCSIYSFPISQSYLVNSYISQNGTMSGVY